MIDYTLIVFFASVFVLCVFWLVAKTIGRLRVVKDSPTVDDIKDFINPKLAEERARAREEYSLGAENLSEAVRALADAGNKLAATKMYMNETGLSLMESKKTVEAYLSNRVHQQ